MPRATRIALILSPLLAWGCAYSTHRTEPYCRDAAAAARVEAEAEQLCGDMRPADGLPASPFRTDGCSASPDFNWKHCCVEHDKAYWCGGSAEQRADADRALRECVAEASARPLGYLVQFGVRIGGHPWWPAPWRWAYGREWPLGYVEPLPAAAAPAPRLEAPATLGL